MARSLTTTLRNALAADHVIKCELVQLDLDVADGGTQRYASAGTDVSWGGYTWTGAGVLGKIERIEEGASLEARGIRMSLSGVPSSLISVALGAHVQGRRARIYSAVFDTATNQIIDAILEWDGRIDTMQIVDSEDGTAQIAVSAESRLAGWEAPNVRMFSDADQKRLYPTDRFFEGMVEGVEVEIVWPTRELLRKLA